VDDAAEIVALGRLLDANQLATCETFRALLEADPPATTERLVAESRGRIVAWAPSGLYESGSGWFSVGVRPEARRRGVGSSIFDHIETRLGDLGADRITTTPNDEDGRQFLLRRGFDVATTVRVSEIDPRTVSTEARIPAECQVVPLRGVIDRAEALFDVYSQGRADVPAQTARTPWSFSEWRAETLAHPLTDLDASVVVLEQGEPVSLAWLYSDREGKRAETLMAATRRDRRGLGLATLAKIESTRRAAELGITRILTGNDLDNAPMLAINAKLGYAPTVVIESYAKSLR
jgi:GNAT superfamily N-acetyltransferase